MPAAFETILYDANDGVCTITLNRPEVFNACNDAVTAELLVAFKQAEKDSAVRAIILTGAGKAFCSGQDLKELESQYTDGVTPVLGGRLRDGYNPVVLKMRQIEKPVIAALNGVAAGAGCGLALAADLRIMAESATFMQAFIHVGLVPDCGNTFYLPRLVGLSKALELCFSGEKIKSDEALRIGLVNRIVPDDQVMVEASKLAGRLATMPTRGIGLTKRLMNQAFDRSLEEQLKAEAFVQETAGRTADHLEGVVAFLEKRKPKFQGK